MVWVMKPYWIIGGGNFGLKAAKAIKTGEPEAKIIIVDKDPKICLDLEKMGYETICGEGIGYLAHNLAADNQPDWIVPAIPVHVVFEWMKAVLAGQYDLKTIPIPHRLRSHFPNPFQAAADQCYISNADFICPDNCSEPETICTYTGEPRPRILNDFLKKIQHDDFRSVVVCSHQLFPGVGGYTPNDLFEALDEIKSLRNPILLSTACRCHGVLNAFRIASKV